jgi:hypothetical protein
MYIVEAQGKRASEEDEPVGWLWGTGAEERRSLEKLGWHLLLVLMAWVEVRKPKC